MRYTPDDVERLVGSGHFVEEWYLDTYPDVRESELTAAEHFLFIGLEIGRDPSPRYTNRDYRNYIDADRDGNHVASLVFEHGPSSAGVPSERSPHDGYLLDAVGNVVCANNFDEAAYLAAYPEVERAQVEPYWHFARFGFAEGRKASFFDRDWYLSRHQDVLFEGFDAFDHFRAFGKAEQREARFVVLGGAYS